MVLIRQILVWVNIIGLLFVHPQIAFGLVGSEGLQVAELLEMPAQEFGDLISGKVDNIPYSTKSTEIPAEENFVKDLKAIPVNVLLNLDELTFETLAMIDPESLELAQYAKEDCAVGCFERPLSFVSFASPPEALPTHAGNEKPSIVIEGSQILTKEINITKAGDRLLLFSEGSKPKIFLRDGDVAKLDKSNLWLEGVKGGQTELFVVMENHLTIIKVNVGESLPFQKASSTLATNLLPPLEIPADVMKVPEKAKEKNERGYFSLAGDQKVGTVPSPKLTGKMEKGYFQFISNPLRSKEMTLQFVDERSDPGMNIIYPVNGVKARVVGEPSFRSSDRVGRIFLDDLPIGSRVLVEYFHPEGHILPGIAEIVINDQTPNYQALMNYKTFDFLSSVNQVVQNSQRASFCGQVSFLSESVEGLSVSLTVDHDGPYYFNRFGPAPLSDVMDASGRFCFLNVKPGIGELVISDDDHAVGATLIPFTAGSHRQDRIVVGNGGEFKVGLTVAASARQQMFSEGYADSYESFEYVDLIHLGEDKSMVYLDPGVIGVEAGYTMINDRVFGLVQASEFEPQLVSFEPNNSKTSILSLLPRGFVEDLYYELAVQADDGASGLAFDQALGAMVVVVGKPDDYQDELEISLYDDYGRKITTGWYFGNAPGVNKAVFFNLEPGLYFVTAKSVDGRLIASDTIISDYWTLSYAELGGQIVVNPN